MTNENNQESLEHKSHDSTAHDHHLSESRGSFSSVEYQKFPSSSVEYQKFPSSESLPKFSSSSITMGKQNGYTPIAVADVDNDDTNELNSDKKNVEEVIDKKNVVYRSTTELINPDTDDNSKRFSLFDCWSCCRVQRCCRGMKESVDEFSLRQWNTLIMICLGTLTSSLSVCLFPPFFPKLAESKGETATVYGMVIGTNCLTAFIVTPIIGKNLESIGVNFAFVAGTLCSGAACCLSGCLEYFGPGFNFVLMSILIRVFHATANAGIITSTIAFIAVEFPSSVAFLFSMTRATMNLAQMFGPILGGALHDIGGFKMPFFVLGATQILVSVICAFFLPDFIGKPRDKDQDEKKVSWSIMKIPGLWISFLTFIFSTMSNGFLSITLEPLVLRQFHISPLMVGILFGLKDGANCMASPIWGWLCDKFTNIKLFILIGSVMGAVSYFTLGPFPGLPLENTLLIVVISLIINGIGVGGQQVAGVISAMRDAVSAGYPDEAETHAFIAGLWSSLSGAGRFVSRAGSGILVDTIGFRNTSAIVTCLNVFVFLFTSLFMCYTKSKPTQDKDPEKEIRKEQITPQNVPKSGTVSVPVIREDLEDSFMIGSASSRISRRNSRAAFFESTRGE